MAERLRELRQARDAVAAWIEDYNREDPHQALRYRMPHDASRGIRIKAIRSLMCQRQAGHNA